MMDLETLKSSFSDAVRVMTSLPESYPDRESNQFIVNLNSFRVMRRMIRDTLHISSLINHLL